MFWNSCWNRGKAYIIWRIFSLFFGPSVCLSTCLPLWFWYFIKKNEFVCIHVHTILLFFSHCRSRSWLFIIKRMSEFNKMYDLYFYFLTENICKHDSCKPFLETCFPWKNSAGFICCEWSSARGQYIKKVRDPIKGEQILNCGKTTFQTLLYTVVFIITL